MQSGPVKLAIQVALGIHVIEDNCMTLLCRYFQARLGSIFTRTVCVDLIVLCRGGVSIGENGLPAGLDGCEVEEDGGEPVVPRGPPALTPVTIAISGLHALHTTPLRERQ